MAANNKAQERNLRNFASLATGEANLVSVVQSAGPAMVALAQKFPAEFSRALRHLAYRIRWEIQAAVRAGGVDGKKWPERSRMHIYRRMDYVRSRAYYKLSLKGELGYKRYRLRASTVESLGDIRGRFSYLGAAGGARKTYSRRGERMEEGQSIPNAFNRWRAENGTKSLRGRGAMSGRMASALIYKRIAPMRYDVGALNPTVAKLLAVAQAGRSQPITEKMRRAMWAAKIPLRKGTKVLVTPERDLVNAVYQKMAPHVADIISIRIASYLEGKSGKSAGEYWA